MKRSVKYLVLAVLASISLSACGDSPAPPTNTVALPTSTTVHTVQATNTAPILRPTNTTELSSNPTPASSDATGTVTFKTYKAKDGNWSIDYPSNWTVNQTGLTTQFLGPNEEAFTQVTYSDIGGAIDADTLVTMSSDNLKKSFGDSYQEIKRAKQPDGSTRIDFSFKQGTLKYVGQAFVEERRHALYLLMMIANPDLASKYDPVFSKIVSSYTLPPTTGAGTSGGSSGTVGGSTTATTGSTSTAESSGDPITPTAAVSGGGTGTADVTYKTYTSKEGNWSIDYPSTWTVNQLASTTQFLGPNAEAFSQVTYTDIGTALDLDTLVDTASKSLKTSFGTSYNETKREKQPDGSTRLDFTFEQSSIKFNGSAFIEERGTGLYILMNISLPDVAQKYSGVFQHIVESYKVPKS